MSELPDGVTKTAAIAVMIYDFAMYAAAGFGLYLLLFTDNDQRALWAFVAALMFNAASNSCMIKILGRRTAMTRHPAGKRRSE